MGHCYICSHLCSNDIKCYSYITNKFTGEIFEFVTKISLFDEYPFEHEFFIKISKSFPLIKIMFIKYNTKTTKTTNKFNKSRI
jgi:hypothetical protein